MKLKDYCKDRIFVYIILAAAWAMLLIFLWAFHVSVQLIVILSMICALAVISAEAWDFFRKRSFYSNILLQLKKLDQKYLIAEMQEEPQFYEGKLFQAVLNEANKSMCENVSAYRRESLEFREFLELWVHEVKLPLSSLLLMTHNHQSLCNTKFLEQLRKIDSYTDTVLYYARSEAPEKDYLIQEVSLKKTVSNTAMKNREDLLLHSIQLKTDNLNTSVLTDSKWLEYILGQLLANSIKYHAKGRESTVLIFAEDLADKVVLHVKDNGIGIPESDLPYIFEKSFTGENGRKHAKSTGMGLYIVRKLCKKLGHQIEARSVPGQWTEFLISFAKNDFYKMQ